MGKVHLQASKVWKQAGKSIEPYTNITYTSVYHHCLEYISAPVKLNEFRCRSLASAQKEVSFGGLVIDKNMAAASVS